MASVYDEREDSIIESRRPTLLDVVEEKNRTQNKKNLIHRFVYVSKLREDGGDRHLIGYHYEKLLKYLQNVYQSEAITGLLLIYLKHIVHVIETSSDMVLKIVQDVHNTECDNNGFATKSKILITSHDIPDRLYGQWTYRMLDIQAHNLEQYESSDDNVKLVGDMLSQLLKLGVYVHKQPKLNLKNALDSLHEKVPELLPQQALIHFLLEEDDSCMVTPAEYLQMYTKPYDVTLDSELTWPLPTRLFPYN